MHDLARIDTQAPAVHISPADGWGKVVDAWLEGVELRSGSAQTVRAYRSTVARFAAAIGGLGNATPAAATLFAYSPTATGGKPSASTVVVRLAAVRSLYRFAIKGGVWRGPNPAADVDRPRQAQPVPKGVDAEGIRALLAAHPDTTAGKRDRAITTLIALTALRRTEALGLRAQDIETDDRGVTTWSARVKGGRVRRRELPAPVWAAIRAYLDADGRPFASLAPDARIFAVSSQGYSANVARYARRAGLGHLSPHGLRHSAAKLRRSTGASIEDVQALLGHASVAVTARYLARLEPETDSGWGAAAAAIGI
jgi:site-specific recombinase XerD